MKKINKCVKVLKNEERNDKKIIIHTKETWKHYKTLRADHHCIDIIITNRTLQTTHQNLFIIINKSFNPIKMVKWK